MKSMKIGIPCYRLLGYYYLDWNKLYDKLLKLGLIRYDAETDTLHLWHQSQVLIAQLFDFYLVRQSDYRHHWGCVKRAFGIPLSVNMAASAGNKGTGEPCAAYNAIMHFLEEA